AWHAAGAEPDQPAIQRAPWQGDFGDAAQRQSAAGARGPVAARVGARRAHAHRAAAVSVGLAPSSRHDLRAVVRERQRPARQTRRQLRAHPQHAQSLMPPEKNDATGMMRRESRGRAAGLRAWPGWALLIATAWASLSSVESASEKIMPSNARQLVLVTTPDWNSTKATLQTFTRAAACWHCAGAPTQDLI